MLDAMWCYKRSILSFSIYKVYTVIFCAVRFTFWWFILCLVLSRGMSTLFWGEGNNYSLIKSRYVDRGQDHLAFVQDLGEGWEQIFFGLTPYQIICSLNHTFKMVQCVVISKLSSKLKRVTHNIKSNNLYLLSPF